MLTARTRQFPAMRNQGLELIDTYSIRWLLLKMYAGKGLVAKPKVGASLMPDLTTQDN